MPGFDTYEELVTQVRKIGKPYDILGYAPGGNPVICVEAGGERDPPIAITAGAHATEHAGVMAAVELIEELDTDHRVYILPSRDPVGLNGYCYALGLALDEEPSLSTYEELEDFLVENGELIHREDGFLLALIGDYGYALQYPDPDDGTLVLQRLKELAASDADALAPLRGRRVFATPSHVGIDGAENLERAYSIVVNPDGMPLHLNRYFTTSWAPVESRCARQLLDDVSPGLTFDNHETSAHEDRYHVSLRPQKTDYSDEQEREIALRITEAVSESGFTLATDDDILSEPTKTVAQTDEEQPRFYSRAGDGAYWVDPDATDPPRSGEGLNATDYAAARHGLAFTLETGMHNDLTERARAARISVKTGVEAFEELHN